LSTKNIKKWQPRLTRKSWRAWLRKLRVPYLGKTWAHPGPLAWTGGGNAPLDRSTGVWVSRFRTSYLTRRRTASRFLDKEPDRWRFNN
jgi:hypothetical protein